MLALAGLSAAGWWALSRQDLVLLTACGFLLSLLCLNLISVLLVSAWLRPKLVQPAPGGGRLELVVGKPGSTGFSIPPSPGFPMVVFGWSVAGQGAELVEEKGRLVERLAFPRRCLQERLVRRVVVRDLLDWCRLEYDIVQGTVVRALPPSSGTSLKFFVGGWVDGQDRPDAQAGAGGDRLEMRRYRHGDPLRYVIWSIYQRTGQLLVRTPERAVSLKQRMALYFCVGPHDGAAASLVRGVLESSRMGQDWRFGVGKEETEDLTDALNLLASSGNAPTGDGLERFLQALERDRYGRCLIVASEGLPEVARFSRLRLSLELWIVFDQGQAPRVDSFNEFDLRLVERSGSMFRSLNR